MKEYYTPTEYKKLVGLMNIICQTNEQKNDHIKSWFDLKKVKHTDKSLKSGDYCFKLEACPELGILRDKYFTDELFIERKNSLSELASSINREAFHYELKRAQNIKHKYLIVEQENGWKGIKSHDYLSQYNEKSFWATMFTFMNKYDLQVIFIDKKYIGEVIWSICKTTLDSYIIK